MIFSGFILLFGALLLLTGCAVPAVIIPFTISGTVTDASGPVAGAIVQVQGTTNQTTSAGDGGFSLHGQGLGGYNVVTVTAWAQGHFIGWVTLDAKKPIWKEGGKGVTLSLNPLYTEDNNQYTWYTFEGVKGSASCGMCHREYKEWQADAHSQSASDPRFITIYRGTNMQGQVGQLTQLTADYKAQALDPTKPYYGPGFRLDYPNTAGNCAACHAPVASRSDNADNCSWAGCHQTVTADQADALGQGDIRGVIPVSLDDSIGAEGVACEYCHKVSAVTLDPKTQLPFDDSPGILSMKLSRPAQGQQVFFGTLSDVSQHPSSYSALETQSQFCAPCHYGVFGGVVEEMRVGGGTVVYNSYGEWLKSPYNNPTTGKSCQDCHMPVANANFSVPMDKGGLLRDHMVLHDHTMRGIDDTSLMMNALTLKSSVSHSGGVLQVQVSLINDKTGHDIPTDQPLRSMMLVIEAQDANGKPIALNQGQTLPDWTGNYAGQPGKAYAQVLRDDWSGETPTVAIWRKMTLVADTRLAPFATDSTTYAFNLPDGNAATVHVSVIYRRALQKVAQEKGWNDPDITMAETTMTVAQ
jgi:Carboxypeptidase regulatory-like domain